MSRFVLEVFGLRLRVQLLFAGAHYCLCHLKHYFIFIGLKKGIDICCFGLKTRKMWGHNDRIQNITVIMDSVV